jgi:hypothetical protein
VSNLTLYELDRAKLQALSAELKAALLADDRAALAALLELADGGVLERPRLVDHFLVPEESSKVLFASLRRVSKKRALTKVMESTHASLEARLRAFDVLRDDSALARSIDRLLNPKRLPWYLRREGATCGWIDGAERAALAKGMQKHRAALTPELVELLDGLYQLDADAVLHDSL